VRPVIRSSVSVRDIRASGKATRPGEGGDAIEIADKLTSRSVMREVKDLPARDACSERCSDDRQLDREARAVAGAHVLPTAALADSAIPNERRRAARSLGMRARQDRKWAKFRPRARHQAVNAVVMYCRDADSLIGADTTPMKRLAATAPRRANLVSKRSCSHASARPSHAPSPRCPQTARAGAVAVGAIRVRDPVKTVRSEERATEGKSPEGKSIPEEGMVEGKPAPEEGMVEGKPMPEEGMVEGKPTPEEGMTEGKPTPKAAVMEAKSVAAECERTGSDEAAACEPGSTKGAAAKASPSEAAAAQARSSEATAAKAATAKRGPGAATKAAVKGRSAERRGCRRNRRGGQSDYYIAHHDAHSLSGDAPQPLRCKLGSSPGVAGAAQSLGLFRLRNPTPQDQSRDARKALRELHARGCDRLR
jgi:hypothetical protein